MSPEEAVELVKSGDRVIVPIGTQPVSLLQALGNRRNELQGVQIDTRSPQFDPGWLGAGWRDSFHIVVDSVLGIAGPAIEEHIVDYTPFLTSLRFKAEDEGREGATAYDVAFTIVSPPDAEGWCSYGHRLSHKRSCVAHAKKVIAEIDPSLGRPIGEGYIHVSEIEAFVDHVPQPRTSPRMNLESKAVRSVADSVRGLLRHGDTIQLGPGSFLDSLPDLGVFDEFEDLGCHSAVARPGFMRALERGNFTGARKTVNPNVAVSSGWEADDNLLSVVDQNPRYLLRDQSYVNDIRTIAAHDNMVAINGAIAIDLGGQITADTIGARLYHGAAGQIEFAMGSALSRGGRTITVIESTAARGTLSRIVPTLEAGCVVSVLRPFADYVVTEFGVAALLGKSLRERAAALIEIAHPTFRDELRSEARRMYGL